MRLALEAECLKLNEQLTESEEVVEEMKNEQNDPDNEEG